MAEEKKLRLSDKLSRFFPDWSLARELTIEQVMRHQSGIHNFANDRSGTYQEADPQTREEVRAILSKSRPDFKPGTRTAYNNANYIVLSLVAEALDSTDFSAIAWALSEQDTGSNPLLLAAIGLVAAGLAFKVSAVPFHAWAPDAYQGASAPVAAFLAAGSKAAGLAVLGRVCLVAFGSEADVLSVFLAGLAALSIVVGSFIALSQTDMKRLLAYSSITHVGYALLGLMAGTPEGVSATMTYAFFYVFMTIGTFGVISALGERGEHLDGYQGLASQRPGTAVLMLIFLLSLTGIPPTAGFVAKFVVIMSAVRAGHVVLAVLAVACSVVTAFIYMRVAVLMYMKEPQEKAPSRFPVAVSAALAVAALVTVVGGISPGILAPWAVSP